MWMKESSSKEVLYLTVWRQALAHCERRKRFSDPYLWDLQHIKTHFVSLSAENYYCFQRAD